MAKSCKWVPVATRHQSSLLWRLARASKCRNGQTKMRSSTLNAILVHASSTCSHTQHKSLLFSSPIETVSLKVSALTLAQSRSQHEKSHLLSLDNWTGILEKHDSNGNDAYFLVPERVMPSNANVIISHSVAKIKTNEEGNRYLRVRICLHVNRDSKRTVSEKTPI